MPSKKNHRNRILFIRFSSIGDILLTTPLLIAVKKQMPDCELDFLTLTEYGSLLKYNPYIDNLHLLDRTKGSIHSIKMAMSLRANNYNYIFDLHRSSRSFIFRSLLRPDKKYVLCKKYLQRYILIKLKINLYKKPYSVVNRYFDTIKSLNLKPMGKPEIWVDLQKINEDTGRIKRIINKDIPLKIEKGISPTRIEKSLFGKKITEIISIMPFAKWKTKEWGDDKFIELGKRLIKETGSFLFIFGGSKDIHRGKAIAEKIGEKAISLAGSLDLPGAALALSLSDCLITNDTGVMHLGGAVSIPVIALFGSTTEELGFFPYETNGEVAQILINCRPCTAKGLNKCPKKHFKCMKNITVEMVYSAVMRNIK